MPSLHLYISTGDSREFLVALEKDGAAFSPDPLTGSLTVTVKHSYSDADADSVFQKALGAGVTIDGSNAILSVLRADTLNLRAKGYFIEFLWQDTASLLQQPVAAGILEVDQRLTREQQTSVPVITTDEPLPFGGGGGGTVTSVSVTASNGVSATILNPTTTPALTFILGAINPISVVATGNVTGANLSGTNTGDNAVNTNYSGLVSNALHTGDASGSTVLTLATVNGNVGTFGSASQTVQLTVDGKGRITAAQSLTVAPALGNVTGFAANMATFLATPTSANLRAALTDEVGTGAAYFIGGALGTPASVTLTGGIGLPLTTGVTGVLPAANGGTGFSSQRLWRLMLTTDVSAPSTAQVTGGETITIPAGTYIINGMNIVQTNSATSGGQSGFYSSSTTSDNVVISRLMTQLSADGAAATPVSSTRIGGSLYQYCHESFMDAPNKIACATFTGRCVFSAPVTITPKVNQRSATDGANPALMKAGSFVQFEIP